MADPKQTHLVRESFTYNQLSKDILAELLKHGETPGRAELVNIHCVDNETEQTKEEVIIAHWNVWKMCSPSSAALASREGDRRVIRLQISPHVLKLLIAFCYTNGPIEFDPFNIVAAFAAARRYLRNDLAEQFALHIQANLSAYLDSPEFLANERSEDLQSFGRQLTEFQLDPQLRLRLIGRVSQWGNAAAQRRLTGLAIVAKLASASPVSHTAYILDIEVTKDVADLTRRRSEVFLCDVKSSQKFPCAINVWPLIVGRMAIRGNRLFAATTDSSSLVVFELFNGAELCRQSLPKVNGVTLFNEDVYAYTSTGRVLFIDMDQDDQMILSEMATVSEQVDRLFVVQRSSNGFSFAIETIEGRICIVSVTAKSTLSGTGKNGNVVMEIGGRSHHLMGTHDGHVFVAAAINGEDSDDTQELLEIVGDRIHKRGRIQTSVRGLLYGKHYLSYWAERLGSQQIVQMLDTDTGDSRIAEYRSDAIVAFIPAVKMTTVDDNDKPFKTLSQTIRF